MKNYKHTYTYDEAMETLREDELAPPGLIDEWEQVEPFGVAEFNGGMSRYEHVDNSYNWQDYDANNLTYQAGYNGADFYASDTVAVAFQLGGDVRGSYTDYFLFKTEDVEHLLGPLSDETWVYYGGEAYEYNDAQEQEYTLRRDRDSGDIQIFKGFSDDPVATREDYDEAVYYVEEAHNEA